MTQINYHNVEVRQQEMIVLENVDLKIEKGEFVYLIGKVGSGKSSLLKTMYGELDIHSGDAEVLGYDMTHIRRKQIPALRKRIGIVFQDFRLIPTMNVYDNIAYAMRVIGSRESEIRKRVPYLLGLVGLSSKARSKPNQLSGGEQQRVALARALVNKPEILLCDEPTGNLDPKNSWEIMKLLEEFNEEGTTVVVVTHNQEIVDSMQKRVITMHKGSIWSDEEMGGYEYED